MAHFENMRDATRNLDTILDYLDDVAVPSPDGGEILCRRMPAMSAAHVVLDGSETAIVTVFMYDPHGGGFVAMTPRDARAFAAAVCRSADEAEADYGRRVQ